MENEREGRGGNGATECLWCFVYFRLDKEWLPCRVSAESHSFLIGVIVVAAENVPKLNNMLHHQLHIDRLDW
jgi:hypothetical protein